MLFLVAANFDPPLDVVHPFSLSTTTIGELIAANRPILALWLEKNEELLESYVKLVVDKYNMYLRVQGRGRRSYSICRLNPHYQEG